MIVERKPLHKKTTDKIFKVHKNMGKIFKLSGDNEFLKYKSMLEINQHTKELI